MPCELIKLRHFPCLSLQKLIMSLLWKYCIANEVIFLKAISLASSKKMIVI